MKLISRFDLNLLVVFDAIYSHGGVTQAARQLNLSQPAISHSLGRLRDAFGDPLFVRTGNSFVPTRMATAIAEPVRAALHAFGTTLSAVIAFDPATSSRRFAIGLRATGELQSFPEIAMAAMREGPGIALASVGLRRRELVRSLSDGRLDLAIDIGLDGPSSLCRVPLYRDDYVLVARSGHPVARDRIDLDTYLSLDHIIASSRSRGVGVEDAALAQLGHSRHIAMRCQHIATAWRLVTASDMVCTVPRSLARAFAHVPGNSVLPLPFAVEPNEMCLYWHESVTEDAGNRWLRDLIIAQIGG